MTTCSSALACHAPFGPVTMDASCQGNTEARERRRQAQAEARERRKVARAEAKARKRAAQAAAKELRKRAQAEAREQRRQEIARAKELRKQTWAAIKKLRKQSRAGANGHRGHLLPLLALRSCRDLALDLLAQSLKLPVADCITYLGNQALDDRDLGSTAWHRSEPDSLDSTTQAIG